MADNICSPVRSRIMSSIKSKNTKPELIVRQHLHALGFRYILHDKRLPGKPDLVLPRYKVIIQVQGCFWHGHESCYLFKWPKSRSEFWKEKINRNIARDQLNLERLLNLGWRVLIWWECNIRDNNEFNRSLTKAINWIRGSEVYMEIR
ncbi:very short patch repair endonuclease [Acinetobacter courvalinii]|uniref:very short patch repair endonuclease n=1 Tax=Acinetobacter courvalinii TaxID=280147 RepID=UPI0028965927|nr:very short patch repair endonuclease [Acinetobacter courvalinii]